MGTINRIAKELKRGKVIICPTDTVYGLIADATNKKAVEKVFKIKKRKDKKPIPIFVKDIKTARKLAEIDKKQEDFLKKAWPGKITAILKSKIKSQKSKIYGVAEKTIALRIPNYKLIRGLLRRTNRPLTGTSANISGKNPSTKIKEVLKQIKGRGWRNRTRREKKQRLNDPQRSQPDLIIDAGNLPKSRPSAVIDLTKEPPKILRA